MIFSYIILYISSFSVRMYQYITYIKFTPKLILSWETGVSLDLGLGSSISQEGEELSPTLHPLHGQQSSGTASLPCPVHCCLGPCLGASYSLIALSFCSFITFLCSPRVSLTHLLLSGMLCLWQTISHLLNHLAQGLT
jgi:hypothetical protein